MVFIQGAGAGTHDHEDARLVDSLRHHLGEGWEVRYPRMPGEDDPRYATWSAVIRRELAEVHDGAVLMGHSVGATILVHALGQRARERSPAAIVLVAAPFVGESGWAGEELELTSDLGERLPPGVPVHVFHGSQDETVPVSHADLYGEAIPQAVVHRLSGRDHQLNDDLSDVARVVATL